MVAGAPKRALRGEGSQPDDPGTDDAGGGVEGGVRGNAGALRLANDRFFEAVGCRTTDCFAYAMNEPRFLYLQLALHHAIDPKNQLLRCSA